MRGHTIRRTRQLRLEIEDVGENWPEEVWESLPEAAHEEALAVLAQLLLAHRICRPAAPTGEGTTR